MESIIFNKYNEFENYLKENKIKIKRRLQYNCWGYAKKMLEPVAYYKPREDRICGIYYNRSNGNYFKHWLSDSEILEFNKK